MLEISALRDLALQLARTNSDREAFGLVEAVARQHFGHILFSVLRFDYDHLEMRRLFSNREDVSPSGGSKPMPESAWGDLVIGRGECYIGRTREDLREVFFDHEDLWAIGYESVMNVPVVWNGRTLGSYNILGRRDQYRARLLRKYNVSNTQELVKLLLQEQDSRTRQRAGPVGSARLALLQTPCHQRDRSQDELQV